jgi:hypothetical protein
MDWQLTSSLVDKIGIIMEFVGWAKQREAQQFKAD